MSWVSSFWPWPLLVVGFWRQSCEEKKHDNISDVYQQYSEKLWDLVFLKKTHSQVVQMGLKLQNTLKRRQNSVTRKQTYLFLRFFFWIWVLTWQTNWADITDFDEVTMAEACRSVVHVHRRRQQQLWTLLRIGQEHPLFRKHNHHHH